MIKVQEAVIHKLTNNSGIQTALGFTVPLPANTFPVRELQSFILAETTYPIISVELSTSVIRPVDQLTMRFPQDVFINLHYFVGKGTSSALGTIESAARTALHGASFSYSGVGISLCEFESMVSKRRDEESGVWEQIDRFHIVARQLV